MICKPIQTELNFHRRYVVQVLYIGATCHSDKNDMR